MKRGKLISIEGMDGSGKTTVVRKLVQTLEEQGLLVMSSKEPGTVWAGAIRKLLLEAEDRPSPVAELLLFLADRAQHVKRIVEPALMAGSHVILDRFCDSTVVYQAYVRRVVGIDEADELNKLATGGLHIPDLTIVIDVPTNLAFERLKARGQVARVAEREGTEFAEQIRQAFLHRAKRSRHMVVIDGSGSEEEVFEQVLRLVERSLQE